MPGTGVRGGRYGGGAWESPWISDNLESDPGAMVDYRERRLELRARPATETERSAVWAAAAGLYGGYDKYQERITGRAIRIFVLEPAPPR